MPFDCPTCGKQGGLSEHLTEEFSNKDYANINIYSEDPAHSLDILYILPPYRCESCLSLVLRGKGTRLRKKSFFTCSLCKEGRLVEFENAAIGEIVVRDTFDKIGELTLDEALVCENCGYVSLMETGKEVED